ncbi:MAG: efflux RND transporter periplasmic adaptor subunit [Endozoicomonas sp.]
MHSIKKLITTLLLFNAIIPGFQTQAQGSSHGQAAPNVTSTSVSMTQIERKLSSIGSLRANQSVDIAPQISGRIINLPIDDGTSVEEGSALVSLDSREQAARVEEARVALQDVRRQLEYVEKLYQRRAVSKDELEAKQARVEMAKATLDSLSAVLDYYTVTAPFSGVLGFNDVSQGALINAGTVITTLDDLSIMKLYFELPENTLSEIPAGTLVQVSTDAWPDQSFSGSIDTINPRIDPLNLTFTARALLDNPDGKLRPGMLMRLNVLRPAKQVLVVPARSVMFNGNDQYVYVIDPDGLPQQRFIRTGVTLETLITVTKGLEEGEEIVDQGVVKVVAGRPVKILQTEVVEAESAEESGENRT